MYHVLSWRMSSLGSQGNVQCHQFNIKDWDNSESRYIYRSAELYALSNVVS